MIKISYCNSFIFGGKISLCFFTIAWNLKNQVSKISFNLIRHYGNGTRKDNNSNQKKLEQHVIKKNKKINK